jgi:hypothetical protein
MLRTALTQADEHFALLVCQPAPLSFDARSLPGLPDRMLPLDELRDLLLAGVAVETSNAVWRQLAHHARQWGPAWVVGAVGVAIPGLTRMAARLSHGAADLAEDIDSELLAGFLHALRTDPLEDLATAVLGRLARRADRAPQRHRYGAARRPAHWLQYTPPPVRAPGSHPWPGRRRWRHHPRPGRPHWRYASRRCSGGADRRGTRRRSLGDPHASKAH